MLMIVISYDISLNHLLRHQLHDVPGRNEQLKRFVAGFVLLARDDFTE